MKFLCVYRPANAAEVECGAPPTEKEMVEMGKLIEEMSKAGVLPRGAPGSGSRGERSP